jgi:hypothetical protein
MPLTMQKYILSLLILLIGHFALAQKSKPVVIHIHSLESINKHAEQNSKGSMALLQTTLFLDSMQKIRTENMLFSLIQRYYVNLSKKNYQFDPVVYKERILLKQERNRFMKNLLTDFQYGKYLEMVASIEKKELSGKKLDIKNLTESEKIYLETLAWDLMLSQVTITDK